MLLALKIQPLFSLQSNSELNYLYSWWWIPPAHFSSLLVLWLSFHCFVFFPMLLDNNIAPPQYKSFWTSSGSIVGLSKVRTPCVFWGMNIPQCIWVSPQHSWKFLRIILLKSIVKVFISLPSSCLISEQAGAGLGQHPPFPSTPGASFPCLFLPLSRSGLKALEMIDVYFFLSILQSHSSEFCSLSLKGHKMDNYLLLQGFLRLN